MTAPAISVVVPVLNEEPNVRPLVEAVRAALGEARPWELLLVDDGSTDGTAREAEACAAEDPRVRLLRLARNYGQTAALQAGFDHARGAVVVTLDGDLQNDPADIPRLLAHLDRWDAVTGWRVNRAAGDSLARRLASRIANAVRNRLSGESIRDSGCTFRAFRRECLRGLTLYRGFHRFLPTLLRMQGYRVLEVPINHRPRRFGRSKYRIFDRALPALADLLVVRWMKARQLRYEVAERLGGDPAGE